MPEPKIEFRDWTPLTGKSGPPRTMNIWHDGTCIGFFSAKAVGSIDVVFEDVKPISRETRAAVMSEVALMYPTRKLTLRVANWPKSDK